MKQLPIGFLDSGFGGLTVVKQSLKQLPNESIIYIGDSARCPYGSRSLEEVKQFVWELTQFLLKKGIKMLVIACNTGTAAALNEIRQQLPIPVVGVIHPGSRAAIKETRNKKIGVIGTQGTIHSHLYETVMKEKDSDIVIKSIATPLFVPIVEENKIHDVNTQHIVNSQLKGFSETEIDTLVLGCTHYPLIKANIQSAIGESVHLIDSGVETINEVSTLLDYFGISRTSYDAQLQPPTLEIYTTGNISDFEKVARNWLEIDDLSVQMCQLKGEEN